MAGLLAHFILDERLTKIKITSLILGVFGVGLCLGLDETLFGWGRFCTSWFIMLVNQYNSDKKVVFDKGPGF